VPINPKVNGTYKGTSGLFAKVNGGWKKAQFGYVKVAGQWKQFWAGELKDEFARADTTSSLGTADSGQAWTIVRSQWRINSGNANTTGAKEDYPLALVDLGIFDVDIQANELSPGMGVALRALNANNWVAIYPYYRREAFTYSYCAQTATESYCIAACPNPSYYNSACLPPNTETSVCDDYFDCYASGCNATESGGEWVCEDCEPCEPDTTEYVCVDIPNGAAEETCIEYYVCDDYCSSSCCGTLEGPYYSCYSTGGGSTQECDWVTTPGGCACCPYYVEGELTCSPGDTNCYTQVCVDDCSPGGYSLVPVYDCCQFGQREVCVQTGTATGFNDYFYIRIAKMENGVFSVIQDIQTSRRWNALKATVTTNNLTVSAYANSTYTDLVQTASATVSLANTAYGIIGAPSLYEDGRNIGAIQVKAIGQ
jgi:hypothetical protein